MKKLIITLGLIALIIFTIGCTQTTQEPVTKTITPKTITLEESPSLEILDLIEEDEVNIGELI